MGGFGYGEEGGGCDTVAERYETGGYGGGKGVGGGGWDGGGGRVLEHSWSHFFRSPRIFLANLFNFPILLGASFSRSLFYSFLVPLLIPAIPGDTGCGVWGAI